MFVINVGKNTTNYLYICQEFKANKLQMAGFPLYSIQGDKYFFVRTEELNYFLEKGGEENE